MAEEERRSEQERDPEEDLDAEEEHGSDEDGNAEEDRGSDENGDAGEARGSEEDGDADSEEDGDAGKKGGGEDISGTTAPSVGPNTTFEREDPEERLARHEQSTEDAMGLDKRRSVVGGQYGASAAKQATLYGGALAVIAALIIGFIVLVGTLDKPPAESEDAAPWSDPQAQQTPPDPLE